MPCVTLLTLTALSPSDPLLSAWQSTLPSRTSGWFCPQPLEVPALSIHFGWMSIYLLSCLRSVPVRWLWHSEAVKIEISSQG